MPGILAPLLGRVRCHCHWRKGREAGPRSCVCPHPTEAEATVGGPKGGGWGPKSQPQGRSPPRPPPNQQVRHMSRPGPSWPPGTVGLAACPSHCLHTDSLSLLKLLGVRKHAGKHTHGATHVKNPDTPPTYTPTHTDTDTCTQTHRQIHTHNPQGEWVGSS